MSLVPQGQSALPAKIVLPGIPLGPVKAPSDEKNVPVDRADKIAASGKFTCPMHLKIRSGNNLPKPRGIDRIGRGGSWQEFDVAPRASVEVRRAAAG